MMTTMNTIEAPATEVPATATRRTFTKEYKLRVLERADRCTGGGEVGKLLRGEGLYSSHLTAWRRQRREGTVTSRAQWQSSLHETWHRLIPQA